MNRKLLLLKRASQFFRKNTLLIVAIIFCTTTHLQAQPFEWVRSMGGAGTSNSADKTWSLSLDNDGNSYVVGTYQATATFGTNTLTAVGNVDAFLAKYTPDGTALWATGIGGPSIDEARGVVVDDSGYVYIAGTFQDSITVNGVTVNSSGSADIYLAKYTNSGSFVWIKKIGGTGNEIVWGMTLDNNGNFYITGQFAGNADFDPSPTAQAILSGVGGANAYLAKYTKDGNLIWAKNMGGGGSTLSYGVAVDSDNNVYATGGYEGVTNFNLGGTGGVVNPYASNADIFLVKYNENGNFIWVKALGGDGGDGSYHVAIDASDNVYITGIYGLLGSYGLFDPGVAPSTGTRYVVPGGVAGIFSYSDVFLAKYDKNGNFKWVNSIGGINSEESWGIAIGRSGNVYLSGSFNGISDFDASPTDSFKLTPVGSHDIFLAKYDSLGNFLSTVKMGSNLEDRGFKVAIDNRGNVYQTGFYRGTADFNIGGSGGTLTSAGHYDGFLVKFVCSDTSSSTHEIVECGANYTFNGITYNSSGTYTHIYPNFAGCDSTVTLNLSILNFEAPLVTINEFLLGVVGTYTTYQWIKNGTDIPGATNATYTVTENGDYQVRVTNTQNCERTSDIYTVTNATSITDADKYAHRIKLFPNPTTDWVTIAAPISVNVSISTLDGRTVLKKKDAKQISIKNLGQGTYLMRFTNQDGSLLKVEKLVRQ